MEKELEEWCPEYSTPNSIGRYCGVSKETVLRWIKKEYLVALRLPEGHHRIHREDFREFLTKFNMPLHPRVSKNKNNKSQGNRKEVEL